MGSATIVEDSGSGLLRERAYHELKRRILLGELEQTPFLSERGLARELGMSNTPVRSAVERLALEGIVTIGPQRGIVVRELTTQEIVDHVELREALEPFLMRKLAGNLTPSQISELEANLRDYERSLSAGDVPRFITLDGDFHMLLAEFSGNAEAERVLRQLRDRIHGVILRISRHVPTRLTESIREHRELFQLLIAGDGRAAAKVMQLHLQAARKALAPETVRPKARV